MIFRKWANSVLKKYLIEGMRLTNKENVDYSKVIGLLNNLKNTNMTKNIASEGLLYFLNLYQKKLEILDN